MREAARPFAYLGKLYGKLLRVPCGCPRIAVGQALATRLAIEPQTQLRGIRLGNPRRYDPPPASKKGSAWSTSRYGNQNVAHATSVPTKSADFSEESGPPEPLAALHRYFSQNPMGLSMYRELVTAIAAGDVEGSGDIAQALAARIGRPFLSKAARSTFGGKQQRSTIAVVDPKGDTSVGGTKHGTRVSEPAKVNRERGNGEFAPQLPSNSRGVAAYDVSLLSSKSSTLTAAHFVDKAVEGAFGRGVPAAHVAEAAPITAPNHGSKLSDASVYRAPPTGQHGNLAHPTLQDARFDKPVIDFLRVTLVDTAFLNLFHVPQRAENASFNPPGAKKCSTAGDDTSIGATSAEGVFPGPSEREEPRVGNELSEDEAVRALLELYLVHERHAWEVQRRRIFAIVEEAAKHTLFSRAAKRKKRAPQIAHEYPVSGLEVGHTTNSDETGDAVHDHGGALHSPMWSANVAIRGDAPFSTDVTATEALQWVRQRMGTPTAAKALRYHIASAPNEGTCASGPHVEVTSQQALRLLNSEVLFSLTEAEVTQHVEPELLALEKHLTDPVKGSARGEGVPDPNAAFVGAKEQRHEQAHASAVPYWSPDVERMAREELRRDMQAKLRRMHYAVGLHDSLELELARGVRRLRDGEDLVLWGGRGAMHRNDGDGGLTALGEKEAPYVDAAAAATLPPYHDDVRATSETFAQALLERLNHPEERTGDDGELARAVHHAVLPCSFVLRFRVACVLHSGGGE